MPFLGENNIRQGSAGQSTGFSVPNSAVFNDGDGEFLSRTFSSGGDRRKWTWAAWIKTTVIGDRQIIWGGGGAHDGYLELTTDSTLNLYNGPNGDLWDWKTTRLFRDPHAWYHVVWVFDSNNATANNRMRLYINGVEETSFTKSANGTQNNEGPINEASTTHKIGQHPANSNNSFDGYLAEVVFLDGTAASPTSFGEFDDNGVWKPIDVSELSFGTTGFHLNFKSAGSDIGDDNSGNSNDFTNNNSVTQTTDSPTTNAATMTQLIARHQTTFATVSSDWTFTNGNRTITHTSGSSGDIMAASSQLLQPGQKYHFEVITESMHSSTHARFQLALVPQSMYETDASPLTGTNDQFEFQLVKSGGTGSNAAAFDDSALTAPTNKPTTNSRLTFEVDMSTIGSTTVKYFFNGSLDTTYSSLGFANEPYYVVSFTGVETDRNGVFNFNFGSSAFIDTPTAGHTGLTAKDAFAGSEPTIQDGSAHFQTIPEWSGNSSSQTVSQIASTNSGFTPDWAIIKSRSFGNGANSYDSVRGGNKGLATFDSGSEDTESDGVTFGLSGSKGTLAFTGAGGSGDINNSGRTYCAWTWKAGGAPTADNSAGQTPTNNSVFRDGAASTTAFPSASIYPTRASINSTAGLSIVEYIGNGSDATLAHGLSAAPKAAWFKNRESAGNNWVIYHADAAGNTHHFFLDLTNTKTAGDRFQDTDPTSSVFSIDGTTDINKNTDEHVAYFFAEIDGYSKFGAYTGNGSSSAPPFVNLGFKPQFILLKNVDVARDWVIVDTARTPRNTIEEFLFMNLAIAEAAQGSASGSSYDMDLISNGFRPITGDSAINGSGNTIAYFAFAEHPFAGTTPATAR
tara:strand:+ start:6597 stop:9152 length:2556 start_codon:yes stop_codon:yes gene_type:complete